MGKTHKKLTKNFTIIDNYILRDDKLGFFERGLLITMKSYNDNYKHSIKRLYDKVPDGSTKISSGLKKLEKLGYLVRRRIYEQGKIKGWEYYLSDNPNDLSKILECENELDLETQEIENHDTENLETENLDQGGEEHENLDQGGEEHENRNNNNIINKKQDNKNKNKNKESSSKGLINPKVGEKSNSKRDILKKLFMEAEENETKRNG